MPGSVAGEVSPLTEAKPRRKRRSRWAYAWLVPVCGIAPWLVPWPWQQAEERPTSDPSSIIVLAHSEAVTGRAGKPRPLPPPSEASVRALARNLAAAAGDGYDMPVSPAAVARVKTTPGPYQAMGRVTIPRIKLNASFGEGVYAKTLKRGPGHWPGTPLPGQAGNAVLSGHRNTHTAPFRGLHLLRPGDVVVVTNKGQKAVTFRVKDTKIVPEARYKDYVVRQPSDSDARMLTLFACHPAGQPVFRIVVRARI